MSSLSEKILADAQVGFTPKKLTVEDVRSAARTLKSGAETVDAWLKFERDGQVTEGLLVAYHRDIQGLYQPTDVLHLRVKEKLFGIRTPGFLKKVLRAKFEDGTLAVGKSVLRITYLGREPGRSDPARAPMLFDLELVGEVPAAA